MTCFPVACRELCWSIPALHFTRVSGRISELNSASIYLASGSPRRAQLLEQIGVRFERLEVSVDERVRAGEPAQRYVRRLAMAKARCGFAALKTKPRRPVLGADTSVMVAGQIFGKPRNRDEGLAMLCALSGTTHTVLSAVAIVDGFGDACRLQISQVSFRVLSERDCEAYWATGEPIGKAGGYAIQGLAGVFVQHLAGSYSGVMGLPLYETAELLRGRGIDTL